MSESHNDDAHEIIPGVWLGNITASQDGEWLRANRIQTVFNCTKQIPFHPTIPNQYRVPVDDNLQPAELKNMELWAPEIAYKMIREYRAGRPMLVHCHAGRQRSAASVAFLLLLLTGRPLVQVMYLIQSRRPVAFFPQPNFIQAMRAFEETVRTQIHPVSLRPPMTY
jgi:hypothetical protein